MNFRYPTSVNSMGFGGYPSFNREVDETPKVVETFIDSSKIQNNNKRRLFFYFFIFQKNIENNFQFFKKTIFCFGVGCAPII